MKKTITLLLTLCLLLGLLPTEAVAFAGDIIAMPGLPRVPAAEGIDVDAQGKITGLF